MLKTIPFKMLSPIQSQVSPFHLWQRRVRQPVKQEVDNLIAKEQTCLFLWMNMPENGSTVSYGCSFAMMVCSPL